MTPTVPATILQWIQIALSGTSLLLILYGVFKIVNRNNEEWKERERRLVAIEEELAEIRKESKDIATIGSQICRLEEEMVRVRDRLDKFIDNFALAEKARYAQGRT